MLNVLLGIAPLLLIFGLYHLFIWFNLFRINRHVYWKRVALVSCVAHFLLLTVFYVFSYFDYQANRQLAALGLSFGAFLFDRSQFWLLITIFDTAAMSVLFGVFSLFDLLNLSLPGVLPLTICVTYGLGAVQWYFMGGGVGALLQHFWTGLKSNDEEDEWG